MAQSFAETDVFWGFTRTKVAGIVRDRVPVPKHILYHMYRERTPAPHLDVLSKDLRVDGFDAIDNG